MSVPIRVRVTNGPLALSASLAEDASVTPLASRSWAAWLVLSRRARASAVGVSEESKLRKGLPSWGESCEADAEFSMLSVLSDWNLVGMLV